VNRAAAQPQVVALGANTPQRFYRGGERILAFRGLPTPADFDGRRPEDWLGSTTRLFAEGGDGLSVLPDGQVLADVLAVEPQAWLGQEHVVRHGADPGLLVKLLDAAERLPVHSHPDRDFATRHLGCAHGKTEAWLVVEAQPGAQVWLGFRRQLAGGELAQAVAAQDDGLLALLNPLEVTRGDAVLVPAGQPHAIGPGVMVVELQEPTDFSVMLEHQRFGLDPDHAWLGLGPDLALQSVATAPLTDAELDALRTRWDDRPGLAEALPAQAAPYFTAQVADASGGPVRLDAGFAVLVAVAGEGSLVPDSGAPLAIASGQVLLVPYAAGRLVVEGPVTVLRCSPSRDPAAPRPDPVADTRPGVDTAPTEPNPNNRNASQPGGS
jgi:mannose-6-phosphate isomerase